MKTPANATKNDIEKLTFETERTVSVNYFDRLYKKIKQICDEKDWKTDWKEGGSYLHLEASEFVESLRGKKGLPEEEFADVMFVLIAMMKDHNIDFKDGFLALENKLNKMNGIVNEI